MDLVRVAAAGWSWALGNGPALGIAGLDEARAYLADPLLRQRLETVISVIDEQLNQPAQTLELLMGSELDAAKTVGTSPSLLQPDWRAQPR